MAAFGGEEPSRKLTPLVYRKDKRGPADDVGEEGEQCRDRLPDRWGVMRAGKEPIFTEEVEK